MSESRYGQDEEKHYLESIRRNAHITYLESQNKSLKTKLADKEARLRLAREALGESDATHREVLKMAEDIAKATLAKLSSDGSGAGNDEAK